ncbi:UNVERIFIED_CONTAM: hypothetical protein Sradi_3856500 [Sesamum radiatum]|uniref:Uncharacterized protein n=1 Tax=Sesamum radiatum TaxID=300843 RepID=A0AAW2Q1Y0_SESRA
MMKALLRRNITCLVSDSSLSIGKSYTSFSFFALYFSTAQESKSLNTPTVFELLRHKHQLSPEVASHVSSVVTHVKNPNNVDSILLFFKEFGFTKTQLEKTLKSRPSLLVASLEKIIPKSKFSKTLVSLPRTLQEFLGSNEKVALRQSGWLLVTDLEKNLVPNVIFLENCGITREQIFMLLNYLPRFLLYKPEIMRKCVDKVEEMGVSRIKDVYIVGSMINGRWELKLQSFRNVLEFSQDDILRALRQNPQVCCIKMKK